MTALMSRPENPTAWADMPGWTVVGDLTPPELINSRFIAVLRRRIVAGLVVVVALCIVGYVYAMLQSNSAADSATAASDATSDLQRATTKYAGITQMESTVDSIRGQVGQVMTNDVDVAAAVGHIRAALPNTMSIQNLTFTLAGATGGAAAGAGSTSLDTSGHTKIGTLSITGSGQRLDDLPSFVDRLNAVKGLTNVLPTSNQSTGGAAQFTLTADLTNQLYTHRYTATKTGGK
jgi:type IV pilus assembly protein PilN